MTAAYLTNVTSLVASLNSAINAISPLKNSTFAQRAPVILQAQQTAAAIDAAIATLDAAIVAANSPGFAGVVAGGFAPAMAKALQAQSTNLQNMLALRTLKGAVGRALFNLQSGIV